MNRSANEQGTAALRGIGRIEGLVADIALLKENLEAVPLWRPATALAAQCDETVRMIRAIAARFDRHPVVTVIGPSGSGKSTLVNALAGGRELSPAGHRRPTTGHLLLFGGGPDAAELAAELDPDSVEVLPAAGTALPEGICLVDTPDTDSMEFQRHLPALERAVAHADVLVCVFDGENPKRRDHADFLAPVVRRFDGESLVAVINKCDRLDEAELKDRILPDLRAYLARGWQRPVDRILCTSARRHVQDPGWDPAAGPRHGFDQFDELRALVFGIAGRGGGWSTGGWRTPGSCTGSCWRRPRASSPPTGRRPGPDWRRSNRPRRRRSRRRSARCGTATPGGAAGGARPSISPWRRAGSDRWGGCWRSGRGRRRSAAASGPCCAGRGRPGRSAPRPGRTAGSRGPGWSRPCAATAPPS